jgi:hypothetical protein
MTDAEILAQAASTWAELEKLLIDRCALPRGTELEAARAGCICTIVDAIRGTRKINVPEVIENLVLDREIERATVPVDAIFKPPVRREEDARWNKLLDDAINGIRE